MSKEWIVTAESGVKLNLTNLSTQKWLDGHYAGLDTCVEWLNEKATALFAQRRIDAAIAMQELADQMNADLRPKMLKRAQGHADDFPVEIGVPNE